MPLLALRAFCLPHSGQSDYIPITLPAPSLPGDSSDLGYFLHVGIAKTSVCNRPLLYTSWPCAVPIIRLLGTTLNNLRLDSVKEWYHIIKKTPCYRNHF